MSLLNEIIKDFETGWHGWCHPEKAQKIYGHIRANKFVNGLEIGAYAGKSACAAGAAMQGTNGAKVVALDPWSPGDATEFQAEGDNKEWWGKLDFELIKNQAHDKRAKFNLTQQVWYYQKTGIEYHRSEYNGEPIDYLHIDGCHSTWNSCTDVLLWTPYVPPGGIIFMDDEEWPTTKPAQDFLLDVCDKLETINHEGCLCGIYRKR
jgi:hypothetical protein